MKTMILDEIKENRNRIKGSGKTRRTTTVNDVPKSKANTDNEDVSKTNNQHQNLDT